ncbi:MAG: nuclear transport factor 2 family protein [Acidobacteria bacterium]|nr:nuclear transport factor 2 family protein [Acidobacteriota bacterium]
MSRRSLFLVITLCVLAGVSYAQPNIKFENELRANYVKLDAALRQRKLEGLTQFYGPNFTLQSDGKTLKKDEAIEQWRSIVESIKLVSKLTTHVDKITFKDGIYTVDYSQASSGKVQYPGSPLMPYTYNGKLTDTWVRDEKGRGLMTASVEKISDFKVNGQSYSDPGH